MLVREIDNEHVLAKDSAFNSPISKSKWWIQIINALQVAFVLGAWQLLLPNGLPGVGDLGVLSNMLREKQRQADQLSHEVQEQQNMMQVSTVTRNKVTDDLE